MQHSIFAGLSRIVKQFIRAEKQEERVTNFAHIVEMLALSFPTLSGLAFGQSDRFHVSETLLTFAVIFAHWAVDRVKESELA
jgi:hypothetical protein